MIIICPVCKKKTTWEENPWKPFCSERCKLIDFDKWVTEEYRIPSAPEEDRREGKREQSNSAQP